ncbi:hypothetical protein BZA77DRAFT_358231 [Pyronema omphalodes]|nr:hypothetical protein BZA77DRAFT_358231 [Pyronema omphalodes]
MLVESTSSVTELKAALLRTRKSARYHRQVKPPAHVHRKNSVVAPPPTHDDRLASELLHLAGLHDDDPAMSSPEPVEWNWPSQQSSDEVVHDISLTVDRRGRMRVIQDPIELELTSDPISRTLTPVDLERKDTVQDFGEVHKPSGKGFITAGGRKLYPITSMSGRFLRSTLLVEKWRRGLKFPERPKEILLKKHKDWLELFDKDLLHELPRAERRLSLSNTQHRIFETRENSEGIDRDPPPVADEDVRPVLKSCGSTERQPKGSIITKTPARRRQCRKKRSAPKGNVSCGPEVEITTECIRPQKTCNQEQERSLPQLDLTTTNDENRIDQKKSADAHQKFPVKQLPATERTETPHRPMGSRMKQQKALEMEISGTPNETRDTVETTCSETLQVPSHSPCVKPAKVNSDDILNTQQNIPSPQKDHPVRPVNPHPFLEEIESDEENNHCRLRPVLQRLELTSAPRLPITPSKCIQSAQIMRLALHDSSFTPDNNMRAPPTPKVNEPFIRPSIGTPSRRQPQSRAIKNPPTPPPSSPPSMISFYRTRTKTNNATTFNPPSRVTVDEDLLTTERGPERAAVSDVTEPYFIPHSPGHDQHRGYINTALQQFNSRPHELPFHNNIHTTTIHSSPIRTKTGLSSHWKTPTQTRKPREKDNGDNGERLKAGSFSAFGSSEVGMAKLDLSRSPTKRTGTSLYKKAFKPPVAGGTPGALVVKKVGGVTVTRYPTQAAAVAGLQGRSGTRSVKRQKTIAELCRATSTAGKRTVAKDGESIQKRRKTEVAAEGNNFKAVRDAW